MQGAPEWAVTSGHRAERIRSAPARKESAPSLTARALVDPARPYPVEEQPTLRVLKSSQKSGSTRPLPESTRPPGWLADESALRFIKNDFGIVSCAPFYE